MLMCIVNVKYVKLVSFLILVTCVNKHTGIIHLKKLQEMTNLVLAFEKKIIFCLTLLWKSNLPELASYI